MVINNLFGDFKDYTEILQERSKKIKKYFWYGDEEMAAKRLGYIWFRMDENSTFYMDIEQIILYEKNDIYSIYGSDDEFSNCARKYSDKLWIMKYPNWEGQSYCELYDKYFLDDCYRVNNYPTIEEVLTTELKINDIKSFLENEYYKKVG